MINKNVVKPLKILNYTAFFGIIYNQGTLILDATCVPQNIEFLQDINLLNEASEILEGTIDDICEAFHYYKLTQLSRLFHVFADYILNGDTPDNLDPIVNEAIEILNNLKTDKAKQSALAMLRQIQILEG